MAKTVEERIEKLEEAVFGTHVDLGRSHGKWSMRQNEVSWERKGILEDWARVYIEKPYASNGNKPRVVCEMNRGITLYAEHISIYKDIIRKMEQVQKMLEGGKVPVTDVIDLPEIEMEE